MKAAESEPPLSRGVQRSPLNDSRSSVRNRELYVALTGNPNCGKTTLFNVLTGLRAKVGNYAGVTVERKEGKLLGGTSDLKINIIDLPGTYSLSPQSLDEQVSRDILFHRLPEVPAPAAVVVVVDASNLQRNLYYATQVIELGYPTIVALNMMDVAEENGHSIDTEQLSAALGVPVVAIVASASLGVPELRQKIVATIQENRRMIPRQFCELSEKFGKEAQDLAGLLEKTFNERKTQASAEALLILSDERAVASSSREHYPVAVTNHIQEARKRLEAAGVDWRSAAIEARYARASAIQMAVTTEKEMLGDSFSDKLDRVLTHKIGGMFIFVAIMGLMFQGIFTFAEYPMGWIEGALDWLGNTVGDLIPEGALNSLVVDGIIAGVGAVIIFLPQICLLFLFISLLEDTGYMARAAFLMDRLMSRVGLHGKSFIPMLSSFGCAIPGIMATRTIESPKDRLVTILVAPLMSCSARLPVYTVLIAACIPERVYGFIGLKGLVMLAMYLLGIVVALGMAWIFKKTLLRGEPPFLVMELPPYKKPVPKVMVRHMWERAKIFLRRAGTVILGISIVLWFLATYPKSHEIEEEYAAKRAALSTEASSVFTEPDALLKSREELETEISKEEAGEKLRRSFAGRFGRALEPLIKPLGFDWKIGIGLISSFAAREVFVSTMSTVYNVGKFEDDEKGVANLAETLRQQKHADGSSIFTPLVGISLMVFYVFALQCVSTVAIVRRETNSWKWPIFQWVYMGVLAWGFAFVTYQGGKLLGF
ncbi:MAG: ferrous iron transport protein B [Verrucomicrobia bacterium]|nr:ferrous iron transport protein B [Verrucomicrobiota bacterium]